MVCVWVWYVCMVHMCVCVHAYMHVEARGQSQKPSTLIFFETDFTLALLACELQGSTWVFFPSASIKVRLSRPSSFT